MSNQNPLLRLLLHRAACLFFSRWDYPSVAVSFVPLLVTLLILLHFFSSYTFLFGFFSSFFSFLRAELRNPLVSPLPPRGSLLSRARSRFLKPGASRSLDFSRWVPSREKETDGRIGGDASRAREYSSHDLLSHRGSFGRLQQLCGAKQRNRVGETPAGWRMLGICRLYR